MYTYTYIWCIFVCFLVCFLFVASVKHNYSHQDLLDIGFQHKITVTHDFYRTHNIPKDIARPPGSPWIVVGPGRRRRRRRERKQKQGSRAGLLARLRKQPHKPPLPSMFLTNARSITKWTNWSFTSPGTITSVTAAL